MSENLFGSTSVKKGLERFLGRLLAVEARLSEEGLTRGQFRKSEVVFGLSQPPTSSGARVRLPRRRDPFRPRVRAPNRTGRSAR